MLILKQTDQFLSIADPANYWLDWHFVFAICSVFFYMAAFGLYFNFWPLSFINKIRTDTYRTQFLSPRSQKINKVFSFLAYGFAGTCFLSVWFFGLSQGYRIDFDRASQHVTRTSIFFGDELVTDTLPLNEIASADFETSKGAAKRLVLNLKSNTIFIPLGSSFTDQDGIELSKNAINQFLVPKAL